MTSDADRARAQLLRRLEGIRDGWEAADAYGKGMLEVTAMRGAPSAPSAPSAPAVGTRADFINPGAVFDSAAEAADAMIDDINRLSIQNNTEYSWGYYRDPHTGKYGYTDPYVWGPTGGRNKPLKISVSGEHLAPSAVMGMGHTHGDYSDEFGRRVEKRLDRHGSDKFSPEDKAFMQRGGPRQGMTYFTLATPSGNFRQYSRELGEMGLVRRAAPYLEPARGPAVLNTDILPFVLDEPE